MNFRYFSMQALIVLFLLVFNAPALSIDVEKIRFGEGVKTLGCEGSKDEPPANYQERNGVVSNKKVERTFQEMKYKDQLQTTLKVRDLQRIKNEDQLKPKEQDYRRVKIAGPLQQDTRDVRKIKAENLLQKIMQFNRRRNIAYQVKLEQRPNMKDQLQTEGLFDNILEENNGTSFASAENSVPVLWTRMQPDEQLAEKSLKSVGSAKHAKSIHIDRLGSQAFGFLRKRGSILIRQAKATFSPRSPDKPIHSSNQKPASSSSIKIGSASSRSFRSSSSTELDEEVDWKFAEQIKRISRPKSSDQKSLPDPTDPIGNPADRPAKLTKAERNAVMAVIERTSSSRSSEGQSSFQMKPELFTGVNAPSKFFKDQEQQDASANREINQQFAKLYSVPAKAWEGVLNATQNGPICVQYNTTDPLAIIGEEDCLNLNCFTPCDPKCHQCEEKLPVMVNIPGGAWVKEQLLNDNDVQYLMTRNVIIVSPNYRVDAFGWLSTEDEIAPGNYGLYDQYLALKWVNENIEYFGGDPNRVTILGGSTGSSSVNFHCFSALSEGLFQRMISQSGTVYFPLGEPYRAAEVAKELGEACGCPTSPSSSLVKCLTEVPAHQIIKKQADLYGVKDGYPPFSIRVWSPVFDHPFFSCNPRNGSCECSKPWMNGFVSHDGGFYFCQIYQNPKFIKLVEKHPYPYLSTFMELENIFPCKKTFPAIMDRILHFYFKGKPVSINNTKAFLDLFTDYAFYWPSVRTTLQHPAPVYYYLYAYITDTGRTGACIPEARPSHSDDLITFLGGKDDKNSKTDLKVINYHVNLSVNFVTTGHPTHGLLDVKWGTAGTESHFKYLDFGRHGVVKEKKGLPYPKRYAFWKSLLQRYGGHCECNDLLQ